jgi:hypothetical protein
MIVRLNHSDATDSACSLSQPKSDLSDLGHLKVPNSGRPEFGWERGGVRGFVLSGIPSAVGDPLTPALSPNGEREFHRACFNTAHRSRRGLF